MRKSSEAARIATPMGVRLRNSTSSKSRSSVTAIVISCSFGMRMPATMIGSASPAQMFTALGRPP